MRRSLLLVAVLLVASVVGISAQDCYVTSVDVHEVDGAQNSFVYSPAFSPSTTVYTYTSTVAPNANVSIQVALTTAQVDDTIEVSVNGQEYTTLYSSPSSNSFSGTFNVNGCVNIVAIVRGSNCNDRYYQLQCVQGSGFEVSSTGSSTPVESSTGSEGETGGMEESSTAGSGFEVSSTGSSTPVESSTGSATETGGTEESSTASSAESSSGSSSNATESSTGTTTVESSTAAEAFNQSSTGSANPESSTGPVVSNRCNAILQLANVVLSPPFQVGVVNYKCSAITAGGSTVITIDGSTPVAPTGSTGASGATGPSGSTGPSSPAMSSSAEAFSQSSSSASTPVTTESSTGAVNNNDTSSSASTPVMTESSTGEAFNSQSSSASTPVMTESSTGEAFNSQSSSASTPVMTESSTGQAVAAPDSSTSTYTYNYPYRRRLLQYYGSSAGSNTGGSALVDNGSTGQANPVTTTASGSDDMSTGTSTTTTESSTAAEAFTVSSTGTTEGGNVFQFGGVSYNFNNGVGQPITWASGSNQIVVNVDGCPTYTITCDTGAESTSSGPATAPSSTAPEGQVVDNTCQLSNLQMANGMKYFPNFSPSVYRYSCSCANTVFLSTITATTFDEMATVTLTTNNGGAVDLLSGVESGSYEMEYGSNRVEIEVQGYDNNVKGCSNTYLFTCYRGGSANDTTIMYNWYSTAYTPCSGVCTSNTGTVAGTFNRTVSCHDSNNNVVDDSYCSGTKPMSDSNCVTVCSTQNRDVTIGAGSDGAGINVSSASSIQASYFVAFLASFAAVMASIKF